jgi:polysaccharide biosynthesis protein PslH
VRILVLSPIAPWPPNGGWAFVIYHDIVQLHRRGHEVHLLAITEEKPVDALPLREVCRSIGYFYKHKAPRWLQAVGNTLDHRPFSITRYEHPGLLTKAQFLLRELPFDIVLVQDIAMAPYGSRLRMLEGVPYFIRGHNVDTAVVSRYLNQEERLVHRLVAWWQLRKFHSYEPSALGAADGFAMISGTDAAELRRWYPGLSADVVGAGTDTEYFEPPLKADRDTSLLVHVGSLTAHTKLQGMHWFCREVLPAVRRVVPSARLRLVGRCPAEDFDRYAGVATVGVVEDVRPHLHEAAIFVAPQFVGSGVRLKIINAMAAGCCIVCTPLACEGIPASNGIHLFQAAEAQAMADQIIGLLRAPQRMMAVGESAREFAVTHYGLGEIGARLEARLLTLSALAKPKR